MKPEATIPALDLRHHALFLDFDGTLVDFAPTPDAIELRRGTTVLLDALSAGLGGALAVISGRRIADLDRHLAPLRLPASGVHGLEFRLRAEDGIETEMPPAIGEARQRIAAIAGPDNPILIEDKGGAIVFHYRQDPNLRGRARMLAEAAARGLDELTVVGGNAIFEVRPRGTTKGDALRRFMCNPPFESRLPVFLGDDVTDEDGIRAAIEAGGLGVKVGPGTGPAPFRLRDIDAVHAWLNEAIKRYGTLT